VVVLDGDGAALMKMGSLATIGYYQPRNLLHVILDNESHDSTGGQQTSSPIIRFAEIAAAANYRRAFTAVRPEEIQQSIQYLRTATGPSLLHVKILPGSPKENGRPKVKPHEVKERFMDFLRTANAPKPSAMKTAGVSV
jgi:phosphonopyruvate decarboxylase